MIPYDGTRQTYTNDLSRSDVEADRARRGVHWTDEQARERAGFNRPHLDRYVREWAADSREREGWNDGDRSTYRFRANVLEAVLAEFAALEAQVKALTEERALMEHKVIACGVAATHPNADLTLDRSKYPAEWESPQLERVRSLRAERDAARREVEALRAEVQAWRAWDEKYFDEDNETECSAEIQAVYDARRATDALASAPSEGEK